ncbi:MAG TPA: YdcF family protein [Bradyrhizobium sp.]|uniref:YdcF family protein n=1 Tax=Bradyrhizobium sp. TaxID=376 RepID=UPI002CEAFFD5|nr:YdcF family protein [Bradyrhizobium sp.]HLZ06455.1 YdcF family protein [Bradyrhizobium sp.]
MFFALSKTLGVMLLPTNFLVGLGVVGLLLLTTRFARAGRRLLIVSVGLLALCAFSPLGSLLLYPLESRFPQWDAVRAPDGIIVLGGPIDADLSVEYDRPVIRSAADRIVAAAALARRYPNARIIFTGGSPNLISHDAREADYAGTIFESLGVDKARLTMERRSRNTYENALFTKELAQPKPGERWLLVTSAYHMPRSVGLFRKVGFPVEPYPVDWHVGPGLRDALAFSTIANDGFARTDLAVREWIGLLAYRITGRIGMFFPGPERAIAESAARAHVH